MIDRLFIGIDPSFRGLGISDGTEHRVFKTDAGELVDDRINDLLDAINNFIFDRPVVEGRHIWILVEGPLLRVMASRDDRDEHKPPAVDGSHLYELGNLMRAIRFELVGELRSQGFVVIYLEVGIRTLRRFTVGDGGAAKKNVPYMVEQIYGKKFERDAGMDKLVAWSLSEYGRAVAAGEEIHVAAALRGGSKRARADARKAARLRLAGAR